jgi:hypothetical protein
MSDAGGSRQAPTEAEVRALIELANKNTQPWWNIGDQERLDEAAANLAIPLARSWLAQRDEIKRLQALHLRRTQDTDHDLRELLAEIAAQRDVVAALVAVLDEAAQFFRNANWGATAIYVERKRDEALGAAAVAAQ